MIQSAEQPDERSGPLLPARSMLPAGGVSHPFAQALTWLLTVFLVLFPKGGVKVIGIPLTWGYTLIGLSMPVLLLLRLFAFRLRFRLATLAALASGLPFFLLFVYSDQQNGVRDFGALVSNVVSFFVLPVAFLMIYPAFFSRVNGVQLSRVFRLSVLSAAIFGIALFVLDPFTGHLIEIPYLTVNADDYGLIEATKHIDRGFFLKLISTYNNGNVYGVATLILMPLYDRLEHRAWCRYTLKLALLLTLSRTVWFGLVVDQLISFGRLGIDALRTFPRLRTGPAKRKLAVILATLVAVLAGSILGIGNLAFLLDPSLGGRRVAVDAVIQSITWLPAMPIGNFSEIIYFSALGQFGILGMMAVILIFVFPLLLLLCNPTAFRSPLRLAACKGLIIYMIVASLDGAINLIPVMAFYWFAYMIFLEGWPGAPQSGPAAVAPEVGETGPCAPGNLQIGRPQQWTAAPL